MEHLSDAEMADKIRAQMPEFNVVPGFSGVAADASSAADAVAPELPEAGAGFTGRLAAADDAPVQPNGDRAFVVQPNVVGDDVPGAGRRTVIVSGDGKIIAQQG